MFLTMRHPLANPQPMHEKLLKDEGPESSNKGHGEKLGTQTVHDLIRPFFFSKWFFYLAPVA
jgi:hypothetical protein